MDDPQLFHRLEDLKTCDPRIRKLKLTNPCEMENGLQTCNLEIPGDGQFIEECHLLQLNFIRNTRKIHLTQENLLPILRQIFPPVGIFIGLKYDKAFRVNPSELQGFGQCHTWVVSKDLLEAFYSWQRRKVAHHRIIHEQKLKILQPCKWRNWRYLGIRNIDICKTNKVFKWFEVSDTSVIAFKPPEFHQHRKRSQCSDRRSSWYINTVNGSQPVQLLRGGLFIQFCIITE